MIIICSSYPGYPANMGWFRCKSFYTYICTYLLTYLERKVFFLFFCENMLSQKQTQSRALWHTLQPSPEQTPVLKLLWANPTELINPLHNASSPFEAKTLGYLIEQNSIRFHVLHTHMVPVGFVSKIQVWWKLRFETLFFLFTYMCHQS